MAIELEKINNLYKERYIVTLNVIEKLHKLIESGEYREIIDRGDKLASHVLNEALNEDEK
jgi:hypothetical protein